jgi:hypothetical protein
MSEPTEFKHPLLEAIEVATLPQRTQPFVIRDSFEKPAGVRFSTVWNEFKKRFYGRTEDPAGEVRLQKYKLLAIAPDGPIIEELGGPSRVEGTVASAFALMRLQGRGQEGFLQVNGYANIFYCRDLKGTLCAVRIGWDGEGWVIDAIPVEDPLAWNGKHEIFCPLATA